jgi:hypothetical protein
VRQTDTDEPILDLFDGLTPETVEDRVLEALGDSALFALRFRQNAARALLFPRQQPGKRSPLWLQRLRGKDLLQVARRHPDFPIVIETFRECLHDHLDVDGLKELLAGIRSGTVQVATRRAESPSPFASSLLFSFTAAFMYQYDEVAADGGNTPASTVAFATGAPEVAHSLTAGGDEVEPAARRDAARSEMAEWEAVAIWPRVISKDRWGPASWRPTAGRCVDAAGRRAAGAFRRAANLRMPCLAWGGAVLYSVLSTQYSGMPRSPSWPRKHHTLQE